MNDKDNSSTPPIYDHQPRVTCTHTHKHASVLGGVLQAENDRSILHGEKKRCFSDDCWKGCNPVKGDTQPNRETHLYRGRGRGGGGGWS